MSHSEQQFYQVMSDRYAVLAGFTPNPASDIALRFHALSFQLASFSARLEDAEKQIFPSTASGEPLDFHAATRGLTRKAATHASGMLLFTRTGMMGSTIIPAATICAVADGIEYETTAASEIAAGHDSVLTPARAVRAGKGGNAAAGTVILLRNTTGLVSQVSNPQPFTGGCDTEDDTALRNRILIIDRQQNNGANGAFYQSAAEAFDGICSARVVQGAAYGEVIVRVAGYGQTAVPQTILSSLQEHLNALREPCTSVSVVNAASIAVNIAAAIQPIDDFDAAKTALQTLLHDEISGYAIGQKLTVARLAQLVMNSGLVTNYRFSQPVTDVSPTSLEVLRAGTVSITQMEG